ncbi:uncharacterized protein EHS24_001919 [Apiotrichum porosum]|uniref:F-box domain-containing protein n=1 Tax=Apiotrichum porosum TaxID=105984 RepID=A0A427XJN1_9TREE|nr:uncharacterized protein EHS24_001919 [Apiotrichum porosum]RSH78993.1 hypothetical protein EHS24_001919 [Apiotrichum porosum]
MSGQPALLQHDMFPGIFDCILDYASRDVLFAFRATCRTNRDRVDARISRHLSLWLIDDSTMLSTPGDQRVPALRSPGPGEDPKAASIARRRALGLTRILDYNLEPHFASLPDQETMDGLCNVQTVRHWSGHTRQTYPISFPTYIEFVNMHCRAEIWAGQMRWRQPPECEAELAQEGVRRWIVNARYQTRDTGLASAIIQLVVQPAAAETLREMVILVTEHSYGGYKRSHDAPPPPPQYGMLQSVIERIASTLPNIQYTLVLDDKFNPVWFGLPEETSPEQFRTAVAQAVLNEVSRDKTESELLRAMDAFQLMSLEEYQSHVGNQQFELQTLG